MRNIKNVRSEELFSAMKELWKNDHRVRIAVTGNSMAPFLREGIDSIELSGADFNKLHFGQITLIKRNNGQHVLHRLVYKKRNSFYISGDAQNWVEGPLLPEQLIAVVTKVWRNDRPISPSNILWQTTSFLWWLRLPARYVFIKPYKVIKQLYNKQR